jgi:hypothetical protein
VIHWVQLNSLTRGCTARLWTTEVHGCPSSVGGGPLDRYRLSFGYLPRLESRHELSSRRFDTVFENAATIGAQKSVPWCSERTSGIVHQLSHHQTSSTHEASSQLSIYRCRLLISQGTVGHNDGSRGIPCRKGEAGPGEYEAPKPTLGAFRSYGY